MDEDDTREAQGGSPIAVAILDLLADPTSTLYRCLRVSDLFCVRLTCREAWRCIVHRPLTKAGVLGVATHVRGRGDHHAPLLRWCLRNGVAEVCDKGAFLRTLGEVGDTDLVMECLSGAEKSDASCVSMLSGVARGGHDRLALHLVNEFMLPGQPGTWNPDLMQDVASGGCVLTAAAMDPDPAAWATLVGAALVKGRLLFAQWVLADVEPTPGDNFVTLAAQSGSLALVEWLHAQGWSVDERATKAAASSGNLAVLVL